MEKMLLKLARQLDSLDEASLMALWSKYATMTSRFEPTKRWEEACLVFSLIQAKRWKNQLFNYSWAQRRTPPVKNQNPQAAPPVQFGIEKPAMAEEQEPAAKQTCHILSFSNGEPHDQTPEEEE